MSVPHLTTVAQAVWVSGRYCAPTGRATRTNRVLRQQFAVGLARCHLDEARALAVGKLVPRTPEWPVAAVVEGAR